MTDQPVTLAVAQRRLTESIAALDPDSHVDHARTIQNAANAQLGIALANSDDTAAELSELLSGLVLIITAVHAEREGA